MDPVKIFISGTIDDMRAEREVVEEAILDTKLASAIRAETASAVPQAPRDWILQQLDACTVYLGLYSHRYGWIIPEESISATEWEFNYAHKRKMPQLIFIRSVRDDEKATRDFQRQEEFLARISDFTFGLLRPEFASLVELKDSVGKSMLDTFSNLIRQAVSRGEEPDGVIQIKLNVKLSRIKEGLESFISYVATILNIPRKLVHVLHLSSGSVVIYLLMPESAALRAVEKPGLFTSDRQLLNELPSQFDNFQDYFGLSQATIEPVSNNLKEIVSQRESHVLNLASHTPEAFARVRIDAALRDSGWDLLDQTQVRLEVIGGSGRADYILLDSMQRPLCVLEAKKEDEDPYDAKEQARGYAENLKAPFVILSNGRASWIYTQSLLFKIISEKKGPSFNLC